MSASSVAAHAPTAHAEHHELGFLRTYIFSTDHKMIGRQFLFLGLLMMILGGLLALIVRWQLAWPETPVPGLKVFLPDTGGAIDPGQYNMAFTMHATIMIFFVIMPVLAGGFGNFLIPLMIGARDMAFPFLNMLSFWVAMVSGVLMLAGRTTRAGFVSSTSSNSSSSTPVACREKTLKLTPSGDGVAPRGALLPSSPPSLTACPGAPGQTPRHAPARSRTSPAAP